MATGSNSQKEGWDVAKMAEWEDPELTFSQRHNKIATTYRATTYENDLKTAEKISHN